MSAPANRRFVKRRNRLVERNLFLVLPVARRLMRSVSRWNELDELLADGAAGLLYAAIRFDAARQVPFARFATRYIRGAMIDGMRRRGRAPRPLSNGDIALCDAGFDLVDARADARFMLSRETDPRRRLVLLLYYLDELTMKRIGRMLGISEARVSQLVNRSLDSVRRSASPPPEGERFGFVGAARSAPLRFAAKRRRAA